MRTTEIFFEIEKIDELGNLEFSAKIDDRDLQRTVFDVIIDAQPLLETFKDDLGLNLHGKGYRIATEIKVNVLLELCDSLGRNSDNPVYLVTEFLLRIERYCWQFCKFSELAKFKNTLDFLKTHMTQTRSDSRYFTYEFFLGGQMITSEMTTDKLLESATQGLSVKQMVKPFDLFFKVCRIGEFDGCSFSVKVTGEPQKTFFDVLVEAKPYLEPFKNSLGLNISQYYGDRFASEFRLKDYLESYTSKGKDADNPMNIVTEFNLRIDGFLETFRFADLLQYQNALEFLRNQPTLGIGVEDSVFLIDKGKYPYNRKQPITIEMPINQFLKESAGRFLTIEMPIGSPFSIKDNRRETRNHSPVVLDNKIKYPRRKEARQQIEIKLDKPADEVLGEITQYMDIAEKIAVECESEILDPLHTICQELCQNSQEKTFSFICASSWSGKTQLVYVLDKLSQHPMRLQHRAITLSSNIRFHSVFHLVMEPESSQNISTTKKDILTALLDATNLDIENIKDMMADRINEGEFNSEVGFFAKTLKLDKEWLRRAQAKSPGREELRKHLDENILESFWSSFKYIDYATESHYTWRTLGMLSHFIDMRTMGDPLDKEPRTEQYYPMTMNEFELKYRETKEFPILVCLDNFNLNNHASQKEQIQLRTLLRYLPFVSVLVLSDNTNAIKFIEADTTVLERNTIWCRIINKLPPVSLGALTKSIPQMGADIMKWLEVSNGRPGIVKLFLKSARELDHLSGAQNLKPALEVTFAKLLAAKPSLISQKTIEGWYEMLFSKAFREEIAEHACSTDLIHSHLTQLTPNTSMAAERIPVVQLLCKSSFGRHLCHDEELDGKNCEFSPHSLFIDVDELAQMIVFSDRTKICNSASVDLKSIFTRANAMEAKRLRKKEIFQSISMNSELSILSFSFRLVVEFLHRNETKEIPPSLAPVRSGNKLQYLFNGAFIIASASAGPTGGSLETFLSKFVSELTMEKLFNAKWSKKSLALLGPIKDQLVPYVIAVNYRAKAELRSIDGVFTGFLPEMPSQGYKKLKVNGDCVPDWVETIGAAAKKRNDIAPSLLRNALALSKKAHCQMFISLEFDNCYGSLERALKHAALKRNEILKKWPKSRKHPIQHLHLQCLTGFNGNSRSEWIKSVRSHCSHVLRLFMLTLNQKTKTIGLELLFNGSTPKKHQTKKAAADAESSDDDDEDEDLEAVSRIPPATPSFPHTTVIIVALNQLCPYELY